MAVTITRTDWIDDDGSGTTGTVLNNAVKTDLYNQIDAALAKVAQLAGGNTFTGNQTIAGTVTINGLSASLVSSVSVATLIVRGTSPAAASGAMLIIANDNDPSLFYIQSFSSGFVTDPQQIANGTLMYSNGPGGLTISCASTNAPMKFHTRGIERMRIDPTGYLLINTVGNPILGQVMVASNGAVNVGICVQNNNPNNTMGMLYFLNSGNGACGNVSQTNSNTCAFNTTSDARLKDDDGRATDLSALRAVVVHDFTWKADGKRARGVFAQEAYDVFPAAIAVGTDDTTDDGMTLARPWMTDYSKFVADLIVGWQQHDTELTALRAALATRKGMTDGQ